jgi:hypothetical protein
VASARAYSLLSAERDAASSRQPNLNLTAELPKPALIALIAPRAKLSLFLERRRRAAEGSAAPRRATERGAVLPAARGSIARARDQSAVP